MYVLRHIREELVWAIDKWLWVISNIMLKTGMVTTKELKENAIFSSNQCCMRCWVVLSNRIYM